MARVPNTVSLEHLLGLKSVTVTIEVSEEARAFLANFHRQAAEPKRKQEKMPVDRK